VGASAVAVAAGEGTLALLGLPQRIPGWVRIANTKGVEIRAGTLALLCYPSNPRGYFDVDLRDAATREAYRALGVRRLDSVIATHPFALEYRYNSLVFRGPEFPQRREGVRRVVVIGDSFTEGWGVRQQDAYPEILARMLEALEPGRWEVLNCGRSNSDFPAIYTDLFAKAIALQPDVLVYGMVLNDAVQIPSVAARRPSTHDFVPVWGVAQDDKRRSRSRILALASDDLGSLLLSRATTKWYLAVYSDANADGWEQTKEYIRRMDAQTRAHGGRFVIALWPILAGLEGRYAFQPIHDRLARFSAKAGVPLHDLLGVFSGRPSRSLWVHPIDMHPNEIAHKLAAASLLPVVRAAGVASEP
jgi:lysophospholipase L1-like esterase